jgi:hypothetical protein
MSSPTFPTPRAFVTQLLNSLTAAPAPTPNDDAENSNPLDGVSDAAKQQLLSLQVMFPNEFVAALDLLDRELVTRFRICDDEQSNTAATEAEQEPPGQQDIQMQDSEEAAQADDVQMSDPNLLVDETLHLHDAPVKDTPANDSTVPDAPRQPVTISSNAPTIYYVASAQPRPSRFATSIDTTSSYEVRLQGWNCSCPAFAFSAFAAIHPESPIPTCDANEAEHEGYGTKENREWSFGGITLGTDLPPVCKHLLACVLVERCEALFGGYVEERVVSWEEAAGWAAGWGD